VDFCFGVGGAGSFCFGVGVGGGCALGVGGVGGGLGCCFGGEGVGGGCGFGDGGVFSFLGGFGGCLDGVVGEPEDGEGLPPPHLALLQSTGLLITSLQAFDCFCFGLSGMQLFSSSNAGSFF